MIAHADKTENLISESMRLRDELIRTTGQLESFIKQLAEEAKRLRFQMETDDARNRDPAGVPGSPGASDSETGGKDKGTEGVD